MTPGESTAKKKKKKKKIDTIINRKKNRPISHFLTILLTTLFFNMRDIIGVSNKLNKNL